MNKESKIYIAGHRGMVGSALVRRLLSSGYENIVTAEFPGLDLLRQAEVEAFFQAEKPDVVVVAAAKVGGIMANNTYRAQFLYENLMIESNVIHTAFKNQVGKLVFLGSSCIYPKLAPQPLREESLLSGYLEFTNEPYAIAKIAGIKLCESYYRQYGCNFFSVMPTNLYGYNDNFDLQSSHVLPALLRKFHEAKISQAPSVTIWGTGSPLREFMYVDDLADAIVFLLERVEAKTIYDLNISHINIGTGEDLSIKALAELIAGITGFEGELVFDASKPDGTPRKLMDVSRLHELGWNHTTSLQEGIRLTYDWYVNKRVPPC